MNRKTVIALTAILIIALAAMGVGYGLWFEDLFIWGTVTTGTLDVGFSGPWIEEWFTNEWGEVIASPEVNPGLFEIKHDTVYCDAWLEGPDGDSVVDEGADHLFIEVGGAYPSYHCLVTFDVTNIGTVPVHLAGPEPAPDADNPEWVGPVGCFDEIIPPPERPMEVEDWATEWAYGEGCDPDPENDLSGYLTYDPDTNTYVGTVTNTSDTCTYLIGLASYQKFDDNIDNQWIYDYDWAWIGPGETLDLVVDLPECASQTDLFYGEIIYTFSNGQRYWEGPPEDRKLDWAHRGDEYCDPTLQLHEGQSAYCSILIHFTNEDGVFENTTYTFDYVIRAYQWNESPDAAPGWPPQ